MQYNRAMIANSKELKALNAAHRDATSKLVLLMNHYHALDMRYFPSEKLREEQRKETEQQIKRLKSHLPDTISSNIASWMNDGELWREELDSVHCLL